jgi:RepB plasmid partitioning protein
MTSGALLRDKNISPKAIRFLKKVTGLRQIEIAELMVNANNYAAGYAEALILGTPKDQLVNPAEPKAKVGLSPEEVARMEHGTESLEKDFKAVEATYTENLMNLTLARTYI